MTPSILLVGCGNMGGALLRGWLRAGLHGEVQVVEPWPVSLQSTTQVQLHTELETVPASFAPDIILLAVKPQQMPAVLPAYGARFGVKPLYVSIAAGRSILSYEDRLGSDARIVRAMPNTPALIGKGITALVAGAGCGESDRQLADLLFTPSGATLWLENEAQMHAATALSGSGPAYVFLILEGLVQAGIAAGLPEAGARALALETVAGSAALAAQNGEDFTRLREQVTSPGGTTAAALEVLMKEDCLKLLLKAALEKAVSRSKELAA